MMERLTTRVALMLMMQMVAKMITLRSQLVSSDHEGRIQFSISSP